MAKPLLGERTVPPIAMVYTTTATTGPQPTVVWGVMSSYLQHEATYAVWWIVTS